MSVLAMVLLCCNWCFLGHDTWSRNFLKELWGVGKGHHWSIWQLYANFKKHLHRHHKSRVSIQWVVVSGIYAVEGMGNMIWASGIQVSRRKMELGWRRKNKINTRICLVIEPFFRTASFLFCFFFLIYPKLLFITGVDQVMEAPSP